MSIMSSFIILDYNIVEVKLTIPDIQINLYIHYSYIIPETSSLKTYRTTALTFVFNNCEKLYELMFYDHSELVEFIINNSTLIIKKENTYYLTNSALLRLL